MKFLLPEMYQILIVLAFIIFGALVHATSQLKVSRDAHKEFTAMDFIILSVIAAFAGTIFGLIALLLFESIIMVLICAGVGAFLGMAGLNKLANAVLEFLVSKVDKK